MSFKLFENIILCYEMLSFIYFSVSQTLDHHVDESAIMGIDDGMLIYKKNTNVS